MNINLILNFFYKKIKMQSYLKNYNREGTISREPTSSTNYKEDYNKTSYNKQGYNFHSPQGKTNKTSIGGFTSSYSILIQNFPLEIVTYIQKELQNNFGQLTEFCVDTFNNRIIASFARPESVKKVIETFDRNFPDQFMRGALKLNIDTINEIDKNKLISQIQEPIQNQNQHQQEFDNKNLIDNNVSNLNFNVYDNRLLGNRMINYGRVNEPGRNYVIEKPKSNWQKFLDVFFNL
jgi:hypothetical protein